MKDLIFERYDHFEILIFISGLFSTFQALVFHGITIFSWLLLLMLFISMAERKWDGSFFFEDRKAMLSAAVLLSMTATELITVFMDEYPAWTSRSINNFILMSSVFLLYFIIGRNKRYGRIYMKGILCSCVIQYLVAYIEYFTYNVFNYDLNEKLFETATKLKDDRLVIRALTTNPGMLVPVVLIGLCFSKKLVIKLMSLLTAIVINSTTCVICVGLFFAVYFFMAVRDKAARGWNINKIVFTIFTVTLLAFIIYRPLRGNVGNLYNYAANRIADAAADDTDSDKSTKYHFRYYWSVPYVFDHIPTYRKVFGYGKNCSGIPFAELYGQYTDMLWIPETDPIAALYDVGILGFLSIYALFGCIAYDAWKTDRMHGIFMSCVLIGGVFYGFQMTWFLLMELICFNVREGNRVEDNIYRLEELRNGRCSRLI